MSNYRWCFFIHLCRHSERHLTIPNPAEQIAAWETGKTITRNDNADRQRVDTPLQQTHPQTVEDADVISHVNGTVELSDRDTELVVYLDIVQGGSIPWGEYYLGLSVIGVGSFGSVAISLLPTAIQPAVEWVTLVGGSFVISAAAHVRQSRQGHLNKLAKQS